MKFLLEKTQDAGHRVTINIPKIIIENAVFQEFYKINQNTKLNGFRKGKVPIKIIEQKYGNSVYYDVFNKLMQKFFFEFLNKEKINIIGYPKYYIGQKKDKDTNFNYSVTYEVYPAVEITKINSIKVEKIIVNLTDEDIKNTIEKKTIIWGEVNRAIKINDRVTINYSIYKNNRKINQFNNQNIQFIVFRNDLLNQLNNIIMHRYINDIVFFKIFFSSSHPENVLKNNNITFKIKITKIEEELKVDKNIHNDKLFKLNFQSIKNTIIQNINQFKKDHLKNQIIYKILKNNPIKIPPILLQEEKNALHRKLLEEYKTKKGNILDKRYHINLKLQAQKRLSTKLILEKIINDNKILIDEKKIDSKIKEISLKYKKPLEIINLYNKNKILKQAIQNLELENEAINFLKNKVKIIEKYYTFNEFISYKLNYSEELYF
ncbi:trigger factor [Buchnera aphidicola (Aphis glycines)]|uniref:Trigger factor n=1 Tax=Buchnera aphidicola (Aphis glycines) TaxID=1265350 RepID=A0A0M4H3T0_9GAMM|nr:trigger factor [Buchnera aphidicola]ALD15401.1 trigger factor [Buchnera aphidicola (Aphis glycines)]